MAGRGSNRQMTSREIEMANELVTCECTCQPGEKFPDGSSPVFYVDETRARWMFEKLAPILMLDRQTFRRIRKRSEKQQYWAVHLNGAHILNILK
jgi:hypothetical protein